jgi:hypothetical protein
LDADYVTSPEEDAQNFRAIAERSALPDYSKDGGVASIAPALTTEWMRGVRIQKELDHASDARRFASLRSAGVDWVVLSQSTATALDCDYANKTVKVCRLPWNRYEEKRASN